ncbi:DUF262 domain-containing protein [Clostridium sp. K25]|uniref:DUF262 domain-containing protein n=1 Tax=Clostridium sp. K25 TaxID=1443109 RepID=UPI00069CCF20|nr:DUF262 domain-containing protein [Clostridium sp. K25]
MDINNQIQEQFTPQSMSLSEIFTDKDPIYQIPDYQRQYSWKDEQVTQLWDDIYEAYLNNKDESTMDTNYFLGSLIVIAKGNGIEDIVDGQQRITTLMILLCVLRRVYPKINSKVDPIQNPKVVKIKKIENCISNSNDIHRLRLQSDPAHASDFEDLIAEKEEFSDIKKPSKKEIENEVKNRYINTAYIFNEYLTNLGEVEAGNFINYLLNQVKLIKITCYDESFAIKLFQVLNDRGMDLSAADIIKGYLLAPISRDEHKHATFMNDWRVIEQWISDMDADNLTDMFTYYQYYLLARNPKHSLVEELKRQFRDKDSNEILRDFKKFVSEYKNIYESSNKIVNSFWYLPWGNYWLTALITAEHKKYTEIDKLRKVLRRFYYLCMISGKTLNGIKQTCFNIISAIKDIKPIEEINKIIDEKLEKDSIIKTALERLNGDVYFEGWIRAVLLLVEYNQTDEDEANFIYIDSNLQSEHILPRNFLNVEKWSCFDKKLGEKYLNTLGNMTLLSGKKNKQAQDYPFNEKIKVYSGLGKNGNKAEGITSFRITQKIVDDYNANKYRKVWNEQSIIDRHNWLISEIGKILEIDTTSIQR